MCLSHVRERQAEACVCQVFRYGLCFSRRRVNLVLVRSDARACSASSRKQTKNAAASGSRIAFLVQLSPRSSRSGTSPTIFMFCFQLSSSYLIVSVLVQFMLRRPTIAIELCFRLSLFVSFSFAIPHTFSVSSESSQR